MEKIVLKAEERQETGKSLVKKLRKSGIIPAVCYKDGKESVNLKVDRKELYRALHTKAGENVLITLEIKSSKKAAERTVMVKEVQNEPIHGDILHVDFNEISLSKAIKVKVPVVIIGEAKEVVRDGGNVDHIMWEVEVECLPTEIPDKIVVDVSGMKIGDTIFVKDLKTKEGVKILVDSELVVAIAKLIKEEVVEAVPVEGAEEPEVIAKGKKPEEGEEAEGEAAAPAQGAQKAEKKTEKKEEKK